MELLIPILLVLVGLMLVGIEVYWVPGYNVVGILGALAIIFGIGYAFSVADFGVGLAILGLAAVGGTLLFLWLRRSGAWDRFVLGTSLRSGEQGSARDNEQRTRYLGKVGLAVTPLRPTGVVDMDGERIEVATEGEFIAAGSRVRVVAMDRRRYFVRLAGNATPSEETTS